jgi:hypothetical protein
LSADQPPKSQTAQGGIQAEVSRWQLAVDLNCLVGSSILCGAAKGVRYVR